MAEKIEDIGDIIKPIIKAKYPDYDMKDYSMISYDLAESYLDKFVEMSDFISAYGDEFELIDQELAEDESKQCYMIFSWQSVNDKKPKFYKLDFEYESFNGYIFDNAKLSVVERVVEQKTNYV